jgi:hypothetical protein
MDAPPHSDFNWIMARCNECYGVITRSDSECYICGLPVPGKGNRFWQPRSSQAKNEPSAVPAVTPLSNALFIASLALTLFSFIAPNKMPVSFGATLGGMLFVARIVSDRIAQKQRLTLSPVTISRLHY